MSSIEDLRQRVAEAEQRFGLIDEARSKYSERLIGLMNAIESRIREQRDQIEQHRAELAQQAAEAERRAGENEQLREMLHSLLRAIEAGGRDVLAETMQALETKVSALVGGSAAVEAEAEPGPEISDQVPETADEAPVDVVAEKLAHEPAPEVDGPVAEAAEDPADDEIAVEPGPGPEIADRIPETADEAPVDVVAEELAHVPGPEADGPVAEAAEDPADDEIAVEPEPGPEIADRIPETADEAPVDVVAEELAHEPVPEVDGPAAEAAEDPADDEIAAEDSAAEPQPELGLEDSAPEPSTDVAAAPEAAPEPEPPVADAAAGAEATATGSVSLTEIMQRVSTMMGDSGPLGMPEDAAPPSKKGKAAEPAPVPPAEKSGTSG